MAFEAKNFPNLAGLSGLSEKLLELHKGLYAGYVANSNKLLELSASMKEKEDYGSPAHNEIRRRFGWEFNGMRLHELYFEAICKEEKILSGQSALRQKIEFDFGSLENWSKDFKNLALSRGIGWVALVFDENSNKLFNVWINEHDAGIPAESRLLLIIDVFEHAFILDYGTNRKDYVESFMKMIDWDIVEKRFSQVSH